ncbi:MAG: hypothetical protein ABIH66_07945 [bacterium]
MEARLTPTPPARDGVGAPRLRGGRLYSHSCYFVPFVSPVSAGAGFEASW